VTWEAVSALATLFTGVVILATVGVGMVQLVELRRATQLEGVMEMAALMRRPEMLEGMRFVRYEFEQRFANDAAFRDEFFYPLKNLTGEHPEHHVLLTFELMGTYVKYRLVNSEAVYDMAASRIVAAWRSLAAPVRALREEKNDPLSWENGEMLAREAAKWLERHTPKNAE
jgi:hypothetical protein